MSDILRADATALRDTAPALHHLSSALSDSLGRLGGVLDDAGDCWGSDDIGRTFAESYVPGVQLVRDAFATLRDDVGDVGDAVAAVADNLDASESRAEGRLT